MQEQLKDLNNGSKSFDDKYRVSSENMNISSSIGKINREKDAYIR